LQVEFAEKAQLAHITETGQEFSYFVLSPTIYQEDILNKMENLLKNPSPFVLNAFAFVEPDMIAGEVFEDRLFVYLEGVQAERRAAREGSN
jgi:hypothetical protein